jgi:hypothetical protein
MKQLFLYLAWYDMHKCINLVCNVIFIPEVRCVCPPSLSLLTDMTVLEEYDRGLWGGTA